MKKLLSLLLLALPVMMMTSCDDDKDLPDVDIAVKFDGVTRVGDVLYVVEGEPLTVESVTLTDHTKKGAVIGGVEYFWDYSRLLSTIVQPYKLELNTEGIPAGNHLLTADISIYAVDYSPCFAVFGYKVKIVESIDDIPGGGDQEQDPVLPATIRSTDDD